MNDEQANGSTLPAGVDMAPVPAVPPSPQGLLTCANCSVQTAGTFCRQCGQRLDTHVHSVWHFTSEAAEVLTHADSSVWATLLPLLTRPGFLSREYFAGRRARYLQPFRLYLITSVLFLLLTSLSSGPGHGIRVGQAVRAPGAAHVTAAAPASPAAPAGAAAAGDDVTAADSDKVDCNGGRYDGWGSAWLLPRLRAACEKGLADNGHELAQRLVHNLGRAMFVFLPVLALLMKLMYWRPKRYYLEHLLLLVHNHAFVFLLLSLFMVVMRWVDSDGLETVLSLAMTGYLCWYLYRSMKVYYGQTRLRTLVKFNLLGIAYLVCAGFMVVATALYSAITL